VRGRPIRSAVVHRLVGPSYLSFNTAAHPQRVSIHASGRQVHSRRMPLRLEPHSITTVKLRRAGGGGDG